MTKDNRELSEQRGQMEQKEWWGQQDIKVDLWVEVDLNRKCV